MNSKNSPKWHKTTLAIMVGAALMAASSHSLAAKEIAGKTIIAKGKVHATETDTSAERSLKRRSPIYGVDVVKTDVKSKTQLRMTDGGMIALKENSELLISNYEFNKADNSGSVVMELVKGGLRSMTGAIKSEKGNYQLKTPVGSIGIRGTHYEVEIIDGEVFIAVWDGAVDITVEATAPGQQEQEVSLGEGEDYAYAKIDEGGEVTELLVPPENFNEGHSSDPQADDPPPPAQEQSQEEQQTQEEIAQVETPESSNADMEQEQQQEQQQQQQQEQETEEVVEVAEEEPEEEDTDFIVENEIETELALTPEEELANLVAARTGTYTYSNPRDVNFSQGSGSNFQAQMTMNFDTSTVETGHMSFDDAQGEWFATFNGIIYQHNIEVDVTFASHGNNRADGDINSIFTNDTNSILSSFELFELDNVNTRVKGKFTLD